MAQFVAFAPGVEVSGQSGLSIIEGMAMVKPLTLEILKEHGLDNIDKDKWYPQQAWLNVYKAIFKRFGPSTLYQIGSKVPENAIFPPDIDSLEKGLNSIDVAYHLNHRGGDIGYYKLTSFGKNEAVMFCEDPYPCDFDRGIINTIVRRFIGTGSTFIVSHATQGGCRKDGGDSCSYTINYVLKQ